MASHRTYRLLQALRSGAAGQSRGISTKAAPHKKWVLPCLLGSAAAVGLYKLNNKSTVKEISDAVQAEAAKIVPSVTAAAPPTPQPSVFSEGKNHALYLWIDLTHTAKPKEVAKVCATLQKMVDKVSDPSMRDEEDEIWAGVGFGPTFLKQVGGKPKQDFTYAHRRGSNGDMPSSSGDVFVHAKCNTPSKLFELAQVFLKSLPAGSVKDFEDIYSFVYKNGRDLSGFIDGTENAADAENRQRIAVEKETGGSYVVKPGTSAYRTAKKDEFSNENLLYFFGYKITQKWIHDLKLIDTEKEKTMEGWVGRKRDDSTEISKKSISSHVARMTGGNGFEQPKPFEIVRQSMPFGTLKDGAGLFFIGYSASPDNLNFMLDMMVGAGGDPHSDDVMKLSKNVKGTYWYFPGEAELNKFA